MEIKGLNFKRTCECSPEQYDVFKDTKQVGYVRLRWGRLTCEYPDCGGDLIYYDKFRYGWLSYFYNEFDSEREREYYLIQIADRIWKKYEEDISKYQRN